VFTNGTQTDKGIGTVVRDGHSYTPQTGRELIEYLAIVCVVVLLKKMVKRKFFYFEGNSSKNVSKFNLGLLF
jgi:hypothetical protein